MPEGETKAGNRSPMPANKGVAQAYYTREISRRDPFLQRARRLSGLTLPMLFRDEGSSGSTDTELPWNSAGAYLVNSFAGNLIFSLFPPGRSPIKLQQDQKSKVATQTDPSMDDDDKAALLEGVDEGLSQVEKQFSDCIDEDGDRAVLTTGALHTIVGGQHGYQLYADGTLRGIPLDNHVTRRDPSGTLISFGIMDALSYETLTADQRTTCAANGYVEADNKDAFNSPCINVYTYGNLREDGRWEIFEEVWGDEVANTRTTYLPKDLPYFFVPFMLLPKEDYGRSYCEQYEADLQSIEGLDQSIIEAAAAMARFLMLLRPGAQASKQAVAEAPNGAVLTGSEGDITVPDFGGKSRDLQVAQAKQEQIADRLAKAFLVFIQRNAERVTAEEIRYVAQQLEKTQAGTYSLAVVLLQMPYAKGKLKALQRGSRVTKLPEKQVNMTILGGMAALGRSAEADALGQAFGLLGQLLTPVVMQVVGPAGVRSIMRRVFASFAIDPLGIIPSAAVAKQMDQAAQMQQMAANPAAVEGIKQVGNNLTQNQVADTRAGAQTDAAAISAQPPAPDTSGATQQ